MSKKILLNIKYDDELKDSAEATAWVKNFVSWYNNEHLHSGIKFVTPLQKHLGLDVEILNKRKLIYEKSREKSPNRWTKQIRNWDVVTEVNLNPLQNKKKLLCILHLKKKSQVPTIQKFSAFSCNLW